jgi:hypothetical protein
MKEDEMGGACNTHGDMRRYLVRSVKVRDHTKDLRADENIILKLFLLLEMRDEGYELD